MEILTKTNVVRFIEISIPLGLMPHSLKKDDRDVLMFTRIIQKYWLKILHTFLGKKMLNLDTGKNNNLRKDTLHIAFIKQSCFVHCFLKLSL